MKNKKELDIGVQVGKKKQNILGKCHVPSKCAFVVDNIYSQFLEWWLEGLDINACSHPVIAFTSMAFVFKQKDVSSSSLK